MTLTKIVARLAPYAAYRWIVYLGVMPVMVLAEVCIAARVAYEVWCALVQQHEAGWRRRKEAVQAPAQAAPRAQPHYGPQTIQIKPPVLLNAAATSSATTKEVE